MIKDEKGVTALLIALLLPVILLFFALALDVISLVLVKHQVQATADAAALAGASNFEVNGVYYGKELVPVFSILPESIGEAQAVIDMNSKDHEFAGRGISLDWYFYGVNTEVFSVTVEVGAPTLLFGSVYGLFDGGGHNVSFQFSTEAEVRILQVP